MLNWRNGLTYKTLTLYSCIFLNFKLHPNRLQLHLAVGTWTSLCLFQISHNFVCIKLSSTSYQHFLPSIFISHQTPKCPGNQAKIYLIIFCVQKCQFFSSVSVLPSKYLHFPPKYQIIPETKPGCVVPSSMVPCKCK